MKSDIFQMKNNKFASSEYCDTTWMFDGQDPNINAKIDVMFL